MRVLIVGRLLNRFDAYRELVETIDDEFLNAKLDVPRHKSLAEHLWCVVGARESYAAAIEQGAWQGFNCSMTAFQTSDFAEKLDSSGEAVERAVGAVADWTEERNDLLAALAEHEVMHEGQIIRHMYAFDRELPASWMWA